MIKLNLIGPINRTGYGIHFTNYATKLIELSYELDINVEPIGPIQDNEYDLSLIKSKIKPIDPNAITIKLWHADHIGDIPGSFRIGYCVWEIEQKIEVLENLNNKIDLLFIPNAKLLPKFYEKPIKYFDHKYVEIPEGVDHEYFKYIKRTPYKDKTRPIILSLGKFEVRKGHYQILEVLKHIPNKCILVALWNNPFVPKEYVIKEITSTGWKLVGPITFAVGMYNIPFYEFSNSKSGCKVLVCLENLHRDIYRDVLYLSDLGLFLNKAEGWNLPLCEAISTGLPVIVGLGTGSDRFLFSDSTKSNFMDGIYPKEVPEKAYDGVFFNDKETTATWNAYDTDEVIGSLKINLDNPIRHIANESFGYQNRWALSAGITLSYLRDIVNGKYTKASS